MIRPDGKKPTPAPLATPAPLVTSASLVTSPPAEPDPHVAVYLHPAQMHAATGPCAIRTLLGSCVAVCLWDGSTHVGGAVHYLLPRGRHSNGETGRYGTLAIPALIRAVCALGANREALKAKIFGGARVLPALTSANGTSLGDHNAAVAWELLAAENVPVVGSDLGGGFGRRVLFQVEDGSAWVWRLKGP